MKALRLRQRGVRSNFAPRDGAKKPLAILCAALVFAATAARVPSAEAKEWTVVLHADDIVVGPALEKLNSRHHWAWKFTGGFEVAVRKSAIPIPTPKCRMDYVMLTMPVYYPENPAQASMEERRAVYDALVRIKNEKKGGLKVRFDAQWYWTQGPTGPELKTCNAYFVLPLQSDAANILP
jgi:hypothetical protein